MFKKAVFPGKYIQGAGVLNELPALINMFGNKGMILASQTVKRQVLPESGIDLKVPPVLVTQFGGECCERELSRLASIVEQNHIDVMIGMGGGKVIDAAKITADRANIPVIIVPTVASTDAPCSGCAVIYSEAGIFEFVYYQKMNPQVVLADTAVIAAAPVRFLVSGMGDALSTWFEAESCYRTQSQNACGGLSTITGLHLSRFCYETLLEYGVDAKTACDQNIVTPALERIVEANTLMSGIGFESSGLATAHSIHNGLTALDTTRSYYHGEKVAFGVLTGLQLTGAPPSVSETVFGFCEKVGLPTTLADIGVNGSDHAGLTKVAEKACAPAEGIHHEAVRVTPEKVLYSMLAADAIGKRRKTNPRNSAC